MRIRLSISFDVKREPRHEPEEQPPYVDVNGSVLLERAGSQPLGFQLDDPTAEYGGTR